MVKKKRGWWSQIQSGDYPEGQTKYGDKNWITFNIKKNAPIEPTKEEGDSEKSLCQLHDNCPNCGKLYFKDKGKCYSCGWSRSSKNEPVNQVKNKIQPITIIKKKIPQELIMQCCVLNVEPRWYYGLQKEERIQAISFGVAANFRKSEVLPLNEKFLSRVGRALPAIIYTETRRLRFND